MPTSNNWSLSRGSWDKLASCEHLAGDTWKKVRLQSHFGMLVPETAGVYLIAAPPPANADRRLPGGLYNVLYVGKSDNLRQRFGDHVRGYGDVRQAKATFGTGRMDFHFVPVPREGTSTVEGLLWLTLGPSANDKAPPFAGQILNPVPPNPMKEQEQ